MRERRQIHVRWRDQLAELIDIQLEDMYGYGGNIKWGSLEKRDVLFVLLDHSDCEGLIENYWLEDLANRMEELLNEYKKTRNNLNGDEQWFVNKTQQFINGAREASINGDPIRFR